MIIIFSPLGAGHCLLAPARSYTGRIRRYPQDYTFSHCHVFSETYCILSLAFFCHVALYRTGVSYCIEILHHSKASQARSCREYVP